MATDHRVNLSIPLDVHLAVKQIAAYNRRSFQEEVVFVLDKLAQRYGFNLSYEYRDAKQRIRKFKKAEDVFEEIEK